MYAGVVDRSSSPGNSAPQLIRFVAKANRTEYAYVTKNSSETDPDRQWWSMIPPSIVKNTRDYLAQYQQSPPSDNSQYVSLPDGTIEIKAAWRPLNPSELTSGRFHVQRVRFYEKTQAHAYCYRNAVWGLVALHIIQKTPSAPYFIYASFEQTDNLLTAEGKAVEDSDGNLITPAPATATTPEVCLVDSRPPPQSGPVPDPDKPSTKGQVILTSDPLTCKPLETPIFCDSPGSRLFYRNEKNELLPNAAPIGNICVNKRDNDIPQYAIDATKEAHGAISADLQKNKIASAPWLYYKLVNVQYYPYDKEIKVETPNGSLYDSQPPYTAKNPARSNFYMANIVVETNRALQLFSGGLSPVISTDWNDSGLSQHKNTIYGGKSYNAGGCLGCHGSQGQTPGRLPPNWQAGDFSVILARGRVRLPERPETLGPAILGAEIGGGTAVLGPRNRSIQ
jgi:hypothetical protein